MIIFWLEIGASYFLQPDVTHHVHTTMPRTVVIIFWLEFGASFFLQPHVTHHVHNTVPLIRVTSVRLRAKH